MAVKIPRNPTERRRGPPRSGECHGHLAVEKLLALLEPQRPTAASRGAGWGREDDGLVPSALGQGHRQHPNCGLQRRDHQVRRLQAQHLGALAPSCKLGSPCSRVCCSTTRMSEDRTRSGHTGGITSPARRYGVKNGMRGFTSIPTRVWLLMNRASSSFWTARTSSG
jgi:hypothetical protein